MCTSCGTPLRPSPDGHELLSAVDIIGCAREGGVGHDVNGERGHIRRSDHASDGKRGAKLVAAFFQLITQQLGGQRRVHESRGNEVDSHRRDFKRQVRDESGERSGACASDAHTDCWASTTARFPEEHTPICGKLNRGSRRCSSEARRNCWRSQARGESGRWIEQVFWTPNSTLLAGGSNRERRKSGDRMDAGNCHVLPRFRETGRWE